MSPRPRDPEGRKHALAVATLEVIAEVGIGRTTHRAVAARADVPLGATTYYFPTLADLIAAGLAYASTDLDRLMRDWADQLGDGTNLPERCTELLAGYLADPARVITEYELFLAAARTPDLRPLADSWLVQIRQILTPLVGEQRAWALAALIDGIALQCLATHSPLDRTATETAIRALCG